MWVFDHVEISDTQRRLMIMYLVFFSASCDICCLAMHLIFSGPENAFSVYVILLTRDTGTSAKSYRSSFELMLKCTGFGSRAMLFLCKRNLSKFSMNLYFFICEIWIIVVPT